MLTTVYAPAKCSEVQYVQYMVVDFEAIDQSNRLTV